jgi:S-adenosylhomocysteine hydrolase
MPKKLTSKKAKKILRHGSVQGQKLTPKQKRFMGARASGAPVRRKR